MMGEILEMIDWTYKTIYLQHRVLNASYEEYERRKLDEDLDKYIRPRVNLSFFAQCFNKSTKKSTYTLVVLTSGELILLEVTEFDKEDKPIIEKCQVFKRIPIGRIIRIHKFENAFRFGIELPHPTDGRQMHIFLTKSEHIFYDLVKYLKADNNELMLCFDNMSRFDLAKAINDETVMLSFYCDFPPDESWSLFSKDKEFYQEPRLVVITGSNRFLILKPDINQWNQHELNGTTDEEEFHERDTKDHLGNPTELVDQSIVTYFDRKRKGKPLCFELESEDSILDLQHIIFNNTDVPIVKLVTDKEYLLTLPNDFVREQFRILVFES